MSNILEESNGGAATHSAMSALLVGSDWACANGDVGTVAYNAELLAVCLADPLRQQALEVARGCHEDRQDAIERWYELRARLRVALRTVDPSLHPCA